MAMLTEPCPRSCRRAIRTAQMVISAGACRDLAGACREPCASARQHGFRNKQSSGWAKRRTHEQNPASVDSLGHRGGAFLAVRQSTTALRCEANASREAWLLQTQLVAIEQT